MPITPVYNQVVWSRVHHRFVRFARWTWDGYAIVMDWPARRELPDYVHPSQIEDASDE